jgi:hypothetical protein
VETIPQILEDAWEHAYPGREAAERNSARREAVGPAARRDSVSIGLSFQCLTGSVILASNRRRCSSWLTSRKYLRQPEPSTPCGCRRPRGDQQTIGREEIRSGRGR